MKETYKLIAINDSGKTQELFSQLIQHDGGWGFMRSIVGAQLVRLC